MEPRIMDYEHMVTDKIADYAEDTGFPAMTDYGITRRELDDYLFDKQAIFDSRVTEKSQYTVLGICIIIPVLLGVGVGLVFALLVRSFTDLSIKKRLGKIRDEKIERYIADVLKY